MPKMETEKRRINDVPNVYMVSCTFPFSTVIYIQEYTDNWMVLEKCTPCIILPRQASVFMSHLALVSLPTQHKWLICRRIIVHPADLISVLFAERCVDTVTLTLVQLNMKYADPNEMLGPTIMMQSSMSYSQQYQQICKVPSYNTCSYFHQVS
jgi:hypothetical protein